MSNPANPQCQSYQRQQVKTALRDSGMYATGTPDNHPVRGWRNKLLAWLNRWYTRRYEQT